MEYVRHNLLALAVLTVAICCAEAHASGTLEMQHPDLVTRLGAKVYLQVGDVAPSISLRVTLSNRTETKTIHRKKGRLKTEEAFTVNLRKLPKGTYTLTAKLSNGTEGKHTWEKPYDGIPRVGLDENNSCCIDGRLFFPLMCKGINGSNIEKWTKYVNTLKHVGFSKRYHTPQGFKQWLDDAQKHGLMAIGPGRGFYWPNGDVIWRYRRNGQYMFDQKIDTDKMMEFIRVARNHPAFLMYEWKDEPDIGGGGQFIPPPEVRRWVEISHREDPQHLVFCNVMGEPYDRKEKSWRWNQARRYTYLHGIVGRNGEKAFIGDSIAQDYYPIESYNTNPKLNVGIPGMCRAMDKMVAWNKDLAHFVACVETCDIRKPNTPCPTPQEVLFLSWANVIHGAKGISWFHYFRPTPPENFEAMAKFKDQTTRLTPVICGPNYKGKSSSKAPAGGRVDILTKKGPDGIYVIAANMNRKPVKATIEVAGHEAKSVEVFDEDRTLRCESGTFSDAFEPLAVHIYRITN